MKLNMLIGSLALAACMSAQSFAGGLLDRMLGLKGSGCDSVCCDTGCSADPTCGCEMSACGDACAAPTCGCEMSACGDACGAAPTCGCEISACGDACAAPTCGCEIASCDPCGCDTGCCKTRRKPLLELLGKLKGKLKKSCCDSCDPCAAPTCGCEISACGDACGAAPTCGCEMNACAAPTCGCEIASCDPCGCDSGCGRKKLGRGLLAKLFKKKSCCDSACDACGCGAAPTCGCEMSSCGGCSSAPAAPVAAPVVNGSAAPMPPAPVVDPSAYLQSNRRVIQATSYVR